MRSRAVTATVTGLGVAILLGLVALPGGAHGASPYPSDSIAANCTVIATAVSDSARTNTDVAAGRLNWLQATAQLEGQSNTLEYFMSLRRGEPDVHRAAALVDVALDGLTRVYVTAANPTHAAAAMRAAVTDANDGYCQGRLV